MMVLLIGENNQILIANNGNTTLLPDGKVDDGETNLSDITREPSEELGQEYNSEERNGLKMKKNNILVFGDSITYGAWDKEKGGWVNRLRLAFENNDNEYNYNIFNLGISGEITEEVKNRFDFECNARYDKDANTIIIFAVGINDTQDISGHDKVPLEVFSNNILSLITNAKKYSDKILFIGLTKVDETKVAPTPWNSKKSFFNKKILAFDTELQKKCLSNDVNYLNVYDLIETEELSDGLHPNEIGHQKLCEHIKNKINDFIS